MQFQEFGQGYGMFDVKQQGILRYWYEDKGYGFISPDDGSQDVFIYYSQLTHMSRPPRVGDTIRFELDYSDIRPKAIHASILGVAPRKFQIKSLFQSENISPLWLVVIIGVIAFMALEQWHAIQANKAALAASPYPDMLRQSISPTLAPDALSCGKKTQCSEMTSCAEALFYLDVCGVEALDANNNQIPCQQSVCSTKPLN